MKGCKKLRVIPTNINLESLEEVNMDGCSRLRSFPDISSNSQKLDVRNTKIEDVTSFIAESWLRLDMFYIGSRRLKRLTHVPECVRDLDLSNSDIKKIPDCVTGLFGLHYLKIKNCRKVMSLQGLPPSLRGLDADDCVSLKSACFSFNESKAYITLDDCKGVKSEKDAMRVSSLLYDPEREIRLSNCFSLEEEARRVIIQQWEYKSVVLPGKEIPPEFTHKAKGNSITIISSGTLSASSRFKACLLLSPSEEVSFETIIGCQLRSNGVLINALSYSYSHHIQTKHLLVFSGVLLKEHRCFEEEATMSEIQFEFSGYEKNDAKNIIECGVQMLGEGEIKISSWFDDPKRQVRFLNCMKLDEEARRAIVQGWAYKYLCIPSKEVPTEFTHRATGNSVTISEGTLSSSTSFRACILLSPNLPDLALFGYKIVCRLRSKGVNISELKLPSYSWPWFWTGIDPPPLLTEHLFVFTGAMFKERRWVDVDSDIQFEFSCNEELSKIVECGVQIIAEEGESSSREWRRQSDGIVKVSKYENVVKSLKTNKHTNWWSGIKKLVGLKKKKKNKRDSETSV